jgi:hypothetical protein
MSNNNILYATIGISLTFAIYVYIYHRHTTRRNSDVKIEFDPTDANKAALEIYKKTQQNKEMNTMIECCSSSSNLLMCTTNENTIYIDCNISMLSDPDYLTEMMTKLDRTAWSSPSYRNMVTTFEKIFEILVNKSYCAHYNFFVITDKYCNILLYVGDNSYRQPHFVSNNDLDYININISDSIVSVLDNYKLVTKIIDRDNNMKSANNI